MQNRPELSVFPTQWDDADHYKVSNKRLQIYTNRAIVARSTVPSTSQHAPPDHIYSCTKNLPNQLATKIATEACQ